MTNCLGCSAPNVCSSCNATATVNGSVFSVTFNDGECFPCNDANCLMCQANFFCAKCSNTSFSLSPTGKCVICPDVNCISCNLATPDTCINCINSLYAVNISTGVCESAECSILNCVTCGGSIGALTCTVCTNGFSAHNGACVQCDNVTNCFTCGTPNVCIECQTNFTAVSGACISCSVANCAICSSNNVCSECVTAFSLNTNQVCITCNVSNCASCSSANVC